MIDPLNFSVPHLSTMDNFELQTYVCELIKNKLDERDL